MLTRGQILDLALQQAGRNDSSIKQLARTWLNLFLQKQYNNFDWKWLEKISAANAVSNNGTSLPDDYRAAMSVTLITSNGSRLPEKVRIVGPEEFEYFKRGVNASGTPEVALLDMTNRLLYFWPLPSSPMTFDLRYLYMPEMVDTILAGDNDEVFWPQSEIILVQSVYVAALQFLDDARYQAEDKKLDDLLAEEKMNQRDQRAGRGTLPLGRSFRTRFGRRAGRF